MEELEFLQIFEQSPVSTQIFNTRGDAVAVNKAWEKLWGTQLEKIQPYNILKDPQLKKYKILTLIRKAFKGETVHIPPIKYIPDETIPHITKVPFRWTKATIFPIKNKKGKVIFVVLQHEDITDRTVKEEKVRESERLFRSIIDSSLDGVRLIDERGNIKYASPSTSKILGYSPKEYQKLNIIDLLHPDDRQIYKEKIRELIENPKKTAHLTYRVKHKNGQWRYMEGVGRNFLSDPDIKGLLSTYQDVTEQKEAEDKLWQTNQTLKAIIHASPLAVYVVDREGKVMMWSKVAEKMFGWSSKEAVGKKLPIVQDEMRSEHEELMNILRSGKSFTKETVRQRKDGSKIDVSISAAPLHDEFGRMISIIAITSDITDRKKMERQKDEFMGIVSHELKTPVTSLRVYAQVLEKRFSKAGDGVSAQLMQKMDAQIGKLSALIRDLLDISKMEGGRLQFNEVRFPISELVDEIIEEVQRTTDKHKIIKRGTSRRIIEADRDRVGQVLTNLLTNAIKYSPDSESILVKVSDRDGAIQVSVRDFGIGIPKAAQKNIFKRFYRVESSSHATIPGIGLGLYMSSQIIQRLGGKIWLKSAGKGTTFYFTLPYGKKS